MLRKFVYNKIFRTTGMLLLLLLLLLFPTSKEYNLTDDYSVKTSSNIKKREVYLIDKDGYVARCKININGTSKIDYAKKLLELLIIDGKYEEKIPNGFKPILPSDIKINNITIKDNNINVDLSKEFYDLTKENFIKAKEAITYNLTSIDGICNVYLSIDGKLLDNFDNKTVLQPFKRSDGINKSYEQTNYKNTNSVTVYFLNKGNNNYYFVPVTKITNDNREKIRIIIDELTSSNIYETNLMSFLNYNTKLLDYELKDDILTLNFNEFLFDDSANKNILEEVIYSICLSVRDNYTVKEVIFTVDGKEITKSVIKNIE